METRAPPHIPPPDGTRAKPKGVTQQPSPSAHPLLSSLPPLSIPPSLYHRLSFCVLVLYHPSTGVSSSLPFSEVDSSCVSPPPFACRPPSPSDGPYPIPTPIPKGVQPVHSFCDSARLPGSSVFPSTDHLLPHRLGFADCPSRSVFPRPS